MVDKGGLILPFITVQWLNRALQTRIQIFSMPWPDIDLQINGVITGTHFCLTEK
jgi:hypothetical protein